MAFRDDFPLPDTEWQGTRPFWEAAARHELVIPRCDNCGKFCWYPRERCRACKGAAFTWTTMSGRARLFSWTVVRHAFLPQFADETPYATGLVALDEDPSVRVVTRFVDCDIEALDFDEPMEAVYRELSFPGIERTVTAPFFRPVS